MIELETPRLRMREAEAEDLPGLLVGVRRLNMGALAFWRRLRFAVVMERVMET